MTRDDASPRQVDADDRERDRPVPAELSTIDTRASILEHFVHSSAQDAGRHDAQRASQLYADDVVLEWPQGRERSASPNRLAFAVHRITGCHDLRVDEYTIRSDGRPVRAVGIPQLATRADVLQHGYDVTSGTGTDAMDTPRTPCAR